MNTPEEPSTEVISIDVLLMQQAWLGRLASALVSEPATAEDLTQSTWLTALRSPPRALDATRSWLRRVFVSRLNDSARQRGRRESREQCLAAADEASARVETPEELLTRMELHRKLAAHLASLDDRLRVVLYLRFVEELEPIEVARRLGIPDGTVRWRLKRGLDELRTRLDADAGGDRQAWLAVLVPLLATSAPARPTILSLRRPWTSWTGRFALSGTILSAVVPAVYLQWCRHESSKVAQAAESLYASGALERAARQAAAPIRTPSASAMAVMAAPSSSCPEVKALEREREELVATLEPLKAPKEHFQESPPNPGLEKRLGADLDEMLARAGKCGHALECRGGVCRVTLVVPESVKVDRHSGINVCFDLPLLNQLRTKLVGQQVEGRTMVYDLMSHAWLSRFEMYIVLATEDLEPATPEQREPPPLPQGWDRERGAIPPGLEPECRESVEQLRAEVDLLVRRISRALPMGLAFAQGARNDALAQEVAQRLKPHLTSGDGPLPLDIECRGRICALIPHPAEPEAQVHWNCLEQTKPLRLCVADPAGDWWFPRLMRNQDELTYLERIEPPIRRDGKDQSALLRIRPSEEQSGIGGKKWVLELARQYDFANIVAECEKRHPSSGALSVSVSVPERCAVDARRNVAPIGVEYGGELVGSELWSCMMSATAQVLKQVEPPACTYQWAGEWRLEFPHPKIDLSGIRD